MLLTSSRALSQEHDVALLDLDGVVYIGPAAVPNAVTALAKARTDGMRLAFVTNNAARPPEVVAAHLRELGVAAQPDEVTTSSQAAAHYLAERLAPGSKVLVVGTTGLIEALGERGLAPVHSADDTPLAVVQGYSPTTDWPMLAEAAVAINRGVPWVATNLDPTVPSARGPLPGNGSLVAALRHATGVTPVATGKPDPTMHRESVERSGARAPLVVGDRLDTDIEGARAVGCPSLLVLTGVTRPNALLDVEAKHRPDYISVDLRGLLVAHTAPELTPDGGYRCGPWTVDSQLRLRLSGGGAEDQAGPDEPSGSSEPSESDVSALRALCAASWAARDQGRSVAVDAVDDPSVAVLARLGIGASA
jgi:HAD superfamily hydrolase (TIGR01450 family)